VRGQVGEAEPGGERRGDAGDDAPPQQPRQDCEAVAGQPPAGDGHARRREDRRVQAVVHAAVEHRLVAPRDEEPEAAHGQRDADGGRDDERDRPPHPAHALRPGVAEHAGLELPAEEWRTHERPEDAGQQQHDGADDARIAVRVDELRPLELALGSARRRPARRDLVVRRAQALSGEHEVDREAGEQHDQGQHGRAEPAPGDPGHPVPGDRTGGGTGGGGWCRGEDGHHDAPFRTSAGWGAPSRR
jgi:hypothetical protein